MKLEKASSWHYQLQGVPPTDLTADLLVIDHGLDPKPYLIKNDGTPRAVAAYLSIGEAEEYRSYWPQLAERLSTFTPVPVRENPDWPGNWSVRFWDTGWQSIVLGLVKKIKDAGFTAIYLDKCDVIYDLALRDGDVLDEVSNPEGKMAALVADIAAAAPELDIILQNAFELMALPDMLRSVDALACEDLLFGDPTTGMPNDKATAIVTADHVATASLPVFVVEYVEKPRHIEAARSFFGGYQWPLVVSAESRSLDGTATVSFPSRPK